MLKLHRSLVSEASLTTGRPNSDPRLGRSYGSIAFVLCCGIFFVAGLSVASAGDLSQYRDFRLGMDRQSVARLAKSSPAQTKVLHRKPALLEEIEWRPQFLSESSSQSDPVRAGVFSFYDGALYRVLITYDDVKTAGLTPEDLTDALAAAYGSAAHPAASITITSEGIEEKASVLSQWEDAGSLLRLVRISYRGRIALLLTAKRYESMAERAEVEARRIEEQEAPQRDAARQKQQAEDEQTALSKARIVNKPNFRP
jgi:hypothetical protein